jgi:hypothetical protein
MDRDQRSGILGPFAILHEPAEVLKFALGSKSENRDIKWGRTESSTYATAAVPFVAPDSMPSRHAFHSSEYQDHFIFLHDS